MVPQIGRETFLPLIDTKVFLNAKVQLLHTRSLLQPPWEKDRLLGLERRPCPPRKTNRLPESYADFLATAQKSITFPL